VQTVQRLMKLVNTQAFDRLDEVFSFDVVDHDPAPEHAGFDGVKAYWAEMSDAFPDLHMEADVLVADDEHVAAAYRLSGTHRGRFQSVAPTGRRLEIRGMQIARFENGKIVERWGATDELGVLGRLNLTVPS
jgi:predicted ester cyclase